MKGHGAKYERKKAIVALLTKKNIEEAARLIGIGSATLLRCLKDPDFDAAYRAARWAAFRQSVARLQQASGAAVTTLLKLMIDPATASIDSRTGCRQRTGPLGQGDRA